MEAKRQTTIIYASSAFGVAFNGLLLFFIATDHSKNNGGYKKMLAIVTVYNIYYAIMHIVLDMGFLMDEYGFVMFSKNFAKTGYWGSYLAIMIYMDAFNMTLTLLAIHCLYRFVQVSGKWRFIFESKKWISGMLIFHLSFGLAWCMICHLAFKPTAERTALSKAELWLKYEIDMDTLGYIGPVFKSIDPITKEVTIRWKTVMGAFGCLSILIVLYISICFGAIKLYCFVRSSMVSERTKRLQYQLLRLLFIQAICPFIFEYFPCVVAMWSGLFGFRLSGFALWVPMFTSTYASSDAFLVILGFKAYRQRLLDLRPFRGFGKKIYSQTENSDQKTAKAVPQSGNHY
ncbi:unnamed protein product, partial [Mesorhabditis belari]|uniref:G protein-coupled receptor n=1 Tax=Mesorhabditis belari TaxID=2138241 RepID=A0AAF3EPV2_9BILA